MPAVVEANGLAWRHAGRERWALNAIDLRIEQGERVLLCGPSGSGKSTLLHAIAGLLDNGSGERSGSVRVHGQVVDAPAFRLGVGVVHQDPATQVVLSRVGDDVALGLESLAVPREQAIDRVHAALSAVGLPLPWAHPTTRLSGGEAQRVALAGAWAMAPDLLLLDEPTSALDPDGVAQFRVALAGLLHDRRRTMVIVEHRVEAVIDLVDRVVALGPDGTVVADGPVDRVLREDGDRLWDMGTWVPGRTPTSATGPADRGPAAGLTEELLRWESLELARTPAGPPVRRDESGAIASGEVTVVAGPNGVGKTTLLLTLAGLLTPAAGRIDVAQGVRRGLTGPPHRWPSVELAARIGLVFQRPEHQFLHNTVGEEVPDAGLLARMGIGHLASHNPFTLSGGEQRRLSVAIALHSRPDLLMLDEPTFGLDRHSWEAIVGLLRGHADGGGAVLAVTHDPFLLAVADRHHVLDPSGVRS